MSSGFDRRSILGGTTIGAIAATTAPALARPEQKTCAPARIGSLQPTAQTRYGKVRGFTSGEITVFRGIPYGASTAGSNRFQPPRPPEPWNGIRDTLTYGYQTPQGVPTLTPPPDAGRQQDAFLLYRSWTPHQSSEDCLRLNVWAPQGSGRRPVMVYMHGGALVGGSGNDLLAYDGENLARRGDVVVVTHNHRLNIFGFLDLSSFGGRWRDSVNIGLQDNVAVLQWVRDNIAQFGGDPDNVTVFGQSGGGFKIHGLMRMPAAKGLFHKAIIQSGVIGGFGSASPDQSRALAERILAKLGLAHGELDKLSELPALKLSEAASDVGFGWQTVHDGRIMIEPMNTATPASLASGVPLLIGTVLNELVNAVDNPTARDFGRTAMVKALAKVAGADASAVADAYIAEYPRLPLFEVHAAAMAALARAPSFDFADTKYQQDGKVWQYLFGWRTPVLGGTPGTFHSAEIAFAFNNADLCVNQTGGGSEAIALAHRVSDAWVAFARHGNPNHSGLPTWPSFDRSHPVMIFDNQCRVKKDPEATGRAIIAKHGGVSF